MLVVAKYTLFQIPSWLLVAFLTYQARSWLGLPDWAAVLIVLAFMTKDAVLFPYLRHAYEVSHRANAASMIGELGVAQDILDPEGYVRLGPELWRAELRGAVPVAAGAAVRVCAVDGLTLTVEAAD